MTNEQKKIIKARVGVLELAKQLDNVSQACKVMGYSRDTFYRYQQAVEEGATMLRIGTAIFGPRPPLDR